MKYLAILGRQPEISMAELELLNPDIRFDSKIINGSCRTFSLPRHPLGAKALASSVGTLPSPSPVDYLSIKQLGGCIKLAVEIKGSPLEYLAGLPEGKLTIGVSDYSEKASQKTAQLEALRLKKILVRHGRSVRAVENKEATLSAATSLHNGLSGKNERKVELIKLDDEWYRIIGVQDIDAYAKRDQARPARDAKVGMLPPKLAQIIINLCGPLSVGATVLDPFCGTGVVLQEVLLMGYRAYGTDVSERMVEYSNENLEWIVSRARDACARRPFGSSTSQGVVCYGARCASSPLVAMLSKQPFQISVGDATSFTWQQPIDAVACEGYLGKPFSKIPTDMELKEQKQECGAIVLGFLKNLAKQIKKDTPVTIAAPAWLRENGEYERLDILDDIEDMGYNVNNKTRGGLLYHRDGQVVARDILILRKK